MPLAAAPLLLLAACGSGNTLSGMAGSSLISDASAASSTSASTVSASGSGSAPAATRSTPSPSSASVPSASANTATPGGGSSSVLIQIAQLSVSGLSSGGSFKYVWSDGSASGYGEVSANGNFPVALSPLPLGSTYSFTITTQPSGETCTLAMGSGMITVATPLTVSAACTSTYSSPSSITQLSASPSIKRTSRAAPVGRQGATSWVDSAGNLWLFGGESADSSGILHTLNDLWKLTPSAQSWVHIEPPIEESSATPGGGVGTPAGRSFAASWLDATGDLWLFGGQGRDADGAVGALNDLWKFSVSTGQWTRIAGSDQVNTPGVYGTQAAPSPANIPGARSGAASWMDSAGNLWLFGGHGVDFTGNTGALNDLWQFTPATGRWTWISGSSTGNPL